MSDKADQALAKLEAHDEFEQAARAMHAAQQAHQAASERYAAAIKKMSELAIAAAPPLGSE